MWEKLLPWIGGIFAVVGLILIFSDIIAGIKRHDKTKTNVVGLIVLSVAIVGYTLTDLILNDSAWPPLASLIWIALFWVYVVLDACLTVREIKHARQKKKTAATIAKKPVKRSKDALELIAQQAQCVTDDCEGILVWQQNYANETVHLETTDDKLQAESAKGE